MLYQSTLVSFDSLDFSNTNPSISIVREQTLSTESFDAAYELIKCKLIQVVELTLSGKNYELLINEEGRFQDSLGGIFTDDEGLEWVIAGHFMITLKDSDFDQPLDKQPTYSEFTKLLEKHYRPAQIPEI